MTRRFFIETFGCQMNELDSEKIAGHLCHDGLQPVADPSQADVVLLNTCSIREKAVHKVYARLGELKKRKLQNRDLVLGVVGCMAQLEGEQLLKKAPFVDIVAGPQKGHVMPELLKMRLKTGAPAVDLQMGEDPEPVESAHILRESPWRAAVTISEGCSRRCAFCVVPFTRGAQRDRNSADIVAEVERLVADGYIEVHLLGQTVTSYRDPADRYLNFAALLKRLAEIDGLKRLRFSAPHPGDFTTALLDVMVSCGNVCDHIHLPAQSGSDRILRSMARGYTRSGYMRLMERIRNASRPISLSTDLIVGFPGETEEDFADTLSLIDAVQYDSVFSFKYSPRPHTPAWERTDAVPEEVMARRLKLLQDQQRLIQYNRNSSYVGKILPVLADDRARAHFNLTGRTTNNKIVNFDGPEDLLGSIVPVEVTGFSPNSLKGIWKR